MNKLKGCFLAALLLLAPSVAIAGTPTPWMYTPGTGILEPLLSQSSAQVKVPYITATTSSTSTIPTLSSTNLTVSATSTLATTTATRLIVNSDGSYDAPALRVGASTSTAGLYYYTSLFNAIGLIDAGRIIVWDGTDKLFIPFDPASRLGISSYPWGGATITNASTTNITNSGDAYIGTVKSGTWNGTAIADGYIASASTWNAKPSYTYASSTFATAADYPTYTYASSTFATAADALTHVAYTYASSTFATIADYPTYTYSSSTFPSFLYASSTFVDFTYASSTFATAADYPTYTYASSTFATIANYPTYTYSSSTFPSFSYASSTFPSFTYASSTFPSFGYASSTFATIASYPTYTYASSTYATQATTDTLVPYSYASSTYGIITGNNTWTGQNTFGTASSTAFTATTLYSTTHAGGSETLSSTLGVTGHTTLTTASSTAQTIATLYGVSAIDATTETALESAIDTLANLTSIQGSSVTVSGNTTLNDWFDQSVKTTASPTFVKASLTNASTTGLTAAALYGVSSIDATTESTIEGAIDSLLSLTSASTTNLTVSGDSYIGTVKSGTWNGTAIDLASYVTGNLATSHLNSGTGAASTTFWRGDGTWATPAGSGDVVKVGTPVDNQLGVWTGDGTIEGTTALTYDGTTFIVTATSTLATTTIPNLLGVAAVDATTESTIEAAMDTLLNLTSIQGVTVTLADAGADAFLGWDDTASAYENLTAGEALAIIGGAANDFDASGDVTVANLTATDSSLTFSGTYDGTTARTIGLNLGNANTWTGKQTFNLASSTALTATTLYSTDMSLANAVLSGTLDVTGQTTLVNASTSALSVSGVSHFGGNVGIGVAAPTNDLQVSGSNALFSNGAGGFQFTLSKNAVGDTASYLFQTNFSGRAEIGLTGDDDFHFKTSDDGSSWNDALLLSSSTGNVSIPQALTVTGQTTFSTASSTGLTLSDLYISGLSETFLAVDGSGQVIATTTPASSSGTDVTMETFAASGVYTIPSGANRIHVELVGGGGSGARANGGGSTGGGGGGEYVQGWFATSTFAGTTTVSITIGAGASGRADNGNGSDGGSSTFGSYLTADGGSAGTTAAGGAGGNPSGIAGLNGLWGAGNSGAGIYSAGGGYNLGAGGASVYGGAGGGSTGASAGAAGGASQLGGNGSAGVDSGSASAGSVPGGGGGGSAGGTSGSGGNGQCIVTTYF